MDARKHNHVLTHTRYAVTLGVCDRMCARAFNCMCLHVDKLR